MNAIILEQFIEEECTPYVRDLIKSALETGNSGVGPRTRRFEFNRFDVVFDLNKKDVLIEDVLDFTQAGAQRVSIAEFLAALNEYLS